MRRLLPRGECTPGRQGRDFDRRVGQHPHLMSTPYQVSGDAERGRNGAAAIDDRYEEATPVSNVGPGRVFAHLTMLTRFRTFERYGARYCSRLPLSTVHADGLCSNCAMSSGGGPVGRARCGGGRGQAGVSEADLSGIAAPGADRLVAGKAPNRFPPAILGKVGSWVCARGSGFCLVMLPREFGWTASSRMGRQADALRDSAGPGAVARRPAVAVPVA